MRPVRAVVVVFAVTVASLPFSVSQAAEPAPAKKEETTKKVERCEQHGVAKALCSRCNSKLEPVFKAKGDWCAEHSRPESQCVLCSPALAKQGVK